MREILFRGKRMDNGEWVSSGNLIHAKDGDEHLYFIPVQDDKFGTVEDDSGNILKIEYGTFYKVEPATVGQSTGLKDGNGKWIFEGDLCQMKIGYSAPEASLMRIVIRNACVGFEPVHPEKMCEEDKDWKPFYKSDDGTMWDIDYFEVIGNIHDNQELLEGAT